VTTGFVAGTPTISAAYHEVLATYSKSLKSGASITITGYAKGDLVLAKNRALVVEKLLKSLVPGLKVTIVTNTKVNSTTVNIKKA
jgi:hypothetical protein